MDFILPPWGYAPPIIWLIYVTMSGMMRWRVPTWVMGVAAVAGLVWNYTAFEAVNAAVSAAIAAVMFLLIAISGVTSRSTTVALIPSMAALPFASWVAFIPGLLASATIAYFRLRKIAGDGYFNMLVGETLASIGNQAGKLTKPDVSRLPVPGSKDEVSNVRVPMSALMTAGVAGTAVLALL